MCIRDSYDPASENSEDITASASSEDPLAAALGSKLTYRPASDVPGPQVIYKEGGTPASTDSVSYTHLDVYKRQHSSLDSSDKQAPVFLSYFLKDNENRPPLLYSYPAALIWHLPAVFPLLSVPFLEVLLLLFLPVPAAPPQKKGGYIP